MHLAQQVEVKGELTLESVQVYSGSGSMGFPGAMGGMGFCPPPPSFVGDMGFCPPPPPSQPAFGGDFGPGFGFPSAPPFSVCNFIDPFSKIFGILMYCRVVVVVYHQYNRVELLLVLVFLSVVSSHQVQIALN